MIFKIYSAKRRSPTDFVKEQKNKNKTCVTLSKRITKEKLSRLN